MPKFYGEIGYVASTEVTPGVWEDVPTERNYYGDIYRNTKRWETSAEYLTDELNINNELSIIADPYAVQHFHEIKYVHWMNAYWKITSAEVQYPRLVLTIGGVYNGPTADITPGVG